MKRGILVLGVVSAMIFTSCKEDATSKVKEENVEVAAARDAKATEYPVMSFDETEYDFGNIAKGTNVEHKFTFTNTGDAPLVIVDAKSSCGCTVPNPPKEPIGVGETGEMLVKFNSKGKPNIQNKTVTITANTWPKTSTLRIKAMVTPAATNDASGPVK